MKQAASVSKKEEIIDFFNCCFSPRCKGKIDLFIEATKSVAKTLILGGKKQKHTHHRAEVISQM